MAWTQVTSQRRMPEILTKTPVHTMQDILPSSSVEIALQNLIKQYRHKTVINNYGVSVPKTILFYGHHNKERKVAAEVVARELGIQFCTVSSESLITTNPDYLIENLLYVFNWAKDQEAVIFIDDIDLFSSDDSLSIAMVARVFSALLRNHTGDSIVICSSHRHKNMHELMMSSFDDALRFPVLNRSETLKFIEKIVGDVTINRDVVESDDGTAAVLIYLQGFPCEVIVKKVEKGLRRMVADGQNVLTAKHFDY